jgi:hypothetical protein
VMYHLHRPGLFANLPAAALAMAAAAPAALIAQQQPGCPLQQRSPRWGAQRPQQQKQ